MKDPDFRFTNAVIALPVFFVLLLWIVFWVEIRFDFDFDVNGIYPRTLSGLQGVIFSPFIHSNIEHLYNNSISLFILLAGIQYFYSKNSLSIIGFGILISGFLTWIIGRNSYHIGASSLIYILISFIFFKGIQTQYYRLVALSLAVVVLYGGMIWYVFPNPATIGTEPISWEGHLSGLVTGLILTLFYKTPEFKKVIKYDWEHPNYNPIEDKFMQRFDVNGNFVNLPPEEVLEETKSSEDSFFTSNPNIVYTFIENKEENTNNTID